VIEQSMFMGASTHYWVKVADKTLRVIATGGSSAILPPGQKVRLIAPPVLHLLKSRKSSQS
jgi:putative spermidine/putrescine transport system ATP-binding protein